MSLKSPPHVVQMAYSGLTSFSGYDSGQITRVVRLLTMTSQPDSDSTFPVPDNDNTSEERTEEFPASDQHDSEATIVGPNAAPETGSGATIDDGRTGPLGADPEMTLEQKIGDILEKFAENLVPEHQDLDQTLPHTSLKPVQIESGARTASLKSFTQTQSFDFSNQLQQLILFHPRQAAARPWATARLPVSMRTRRKTSLRVWVIFRTFRRDMAVAPTS